MSSNQGNQQTEGICVGIRLRPLNEREITSGQEKIFTSHNNCVQQVYHGQPVENQTHYYDKVFGENSTTAEVYEATARNIVQGVLSGINGCIFAYGQTSSGKTHTMLGSGDQLGVLNMAVMDIFAHIQANPNRDFIMRASFVEIYNEAIRDLLPNSNETPYVAIRVDPRRGVYCEASEHMVSTYEGINSLLNYGVSRRAVESTAMNDTSSRSHTIFKLVIESRESNRNGYEGDGAVLVANLNLVDLAGSESARLTNAQGKVAKEGGNINKSLLSLSRVIKALSDPTAHVGYRDSKLTHLLQPSLAGNAKMSIICCITTASNYTEETRSTLQFASRAKLVVTHATVNEVVDDAVIIKRLKRELEELKAVTSDEAVARLRELQERSTQLEEQLSVKEATIEQLKTHYETMSSGRNSDASTASIDTFTGSDRRTSKRLRADGEADEGCDEEKEDEVAPSLVNIKNALSLMHARRVQSPGLPLVVAAAFQAAAPIVVAASVPKVEEVKAVPFNPMTLGLRNQLMKELDFKLVARKSKVDSSDAAPMEEVKEDENVVANRALTAEVAQLQEALAAAQRTIETQELNLGEAATALDQVSERLEAELLASAEMKTAETEAQEALSMKLASAEALISSLQEQLLQVTQSNLAAANAAEDSAVAELQTENDKLQEEVSSLLSQLEDLQTSSQKENMLLQKEVTDLLEQMEQGHSDEGVTAEFESLLQAKEEELSTANAALTEAHAEVDSIKEELLAATAALTSAQTEAVAIQEELSAASSAAAAEVDSVKEEIATATAALAEAHSEVDTVKEELSAVNAALIEAQEAASSAATELEGVKENLSVATVALADAQAELGNVEQELSAAKEALIELQASSDASAESLSEAQSASEAHLAAIASLETAAVAAEEQITSLEAVVASHNEKMEAMQSELDSSVEVIANLEAELAASAEKLASAEANHAAEMEKVVAGQASISVDADKLSALEAECASALEIIESMEVDRAADADKMASLEAELAASLEKIESVEAERAADVEKIASLETARANDAESVAAMEAKLSEVIEQGLLAEEHLEAARDQVTELQCAVAAAEDKVEGLDAEMSTLLKTSAELEDNLAHAQELYADSQKDLQAARAEVAALQISLQQATDAVAQASTVPMEEALSSEELLALQTELSASKEECESLAEKLAVSQETESAALEQINALTARVEEIGSSLIESRERFSALEAEKAALVERIEKLEAEVAEHITNSAANSEIITELEASLEQSLNEQQSAEEELSSLTKSVEDLTAQKHELSEQIETLQNQLGAAEEQIKELKPASPKDANGAGVARMSEFDMSQQTLDASRKEMERQVANVQAELGNKEAEVSRLMAALTEAQERAVTAEQRMASVDNAYDSNESEGAKKRIAQLQTSVDLLNGEKESFALKIQAVEKQLKSAECEAAVAVEKMERETAVLNRQIEKLTQDAAQFARMQENANEVKRRLEDTIMQRDQHQQRADAAAQRIDVLESQIEQLQSKVDPSSEDASASEQVVQLRAEKAQLQDDLAELSIRLKKSQEATAQLREQWEQSEPERAALQEDLEAALDDISKLTDALEEAHRAADEAAAERASTSSAGIAMESMEPAAEETISALESELEQLKAEKEMHALEAEVQRDELNQKISELEEDLSAAQVQLEESRSTCAGLEEEIAKLGESKKADAADLHQLHGVCKHQADHVAELIAQLETAQAQLAEQQTNQNDTFHAEKASVEKRISDLEDALESAEQKLQFQIESAAQELEVASNSAFEEMSAMQEQLAAKSEELSASTEEVQRLTEASKAVQEEFASLAAKSSVQEGLIAELESELAELRQNGNATSEAEETLRVALEAVKLELANAREELRAANEHCAVNEDMVTSLQEQLEVKEARIVHLDACKLTKEQTEKIAVMKEERKKFQEDAKTLKKQLHQLLIKFDELKKASAEQRNNGVGGGPSTDYIISDLRVQLVTTAQQLSQTQEEVKLLKSKLKECAVQLKEYENDHSGVVAVLERYQIDTRGLIPLDHSVDDESSILHGDIADAVAQLGEKLDVAKAAVARREVTKSEKVTELEDRLCQVTAEAEEAKVQKVALEKRLEVMKAAAKTARELQGNNTVEIEALTANVQALKAELNAAKRQVTSSSDEVSSAVQALEEENIELLKENKDLRVQVSRLKAGASASVAAPVPSAANSVVSSPVPTGRAAPNTGSLSGQKRAFGTDISNTVPNSAVKSAASNVTKPHISAASTTPATAADSQLDEAASAVGNTRRTRTKVGKAAVKATPQVQDEAGDCKQS